MRDSLADHVILFTATPINRGASDLLQLVGLLGALNALVERDPDACRDQESGRVARYPQHHARTYPTGELPNFSGSSDIVDVSKQIELVSDAEPQQWDAIQDALGPVRSLVEGRLSKHTVARRRSVFGTTRLRSVRAVDGRVR